VSGLKLWTGFNCPFLFTEFSKGMILPKKGDVNTSKGDSVASLSAGFNRQVRAVFKRIFVQVKGKPPPTPHH
jgi:hypothetical protein